MNKKLVLRAVVIRICVIYLYSKVVSVFLGLFV